MVSFREKPPWETKIDPYAGRDEMQIKTEASQDIRKKEMARGGKWAKYEKDRQKALKGRRDYFRKHPDKKDDMSGV